MPDIFSIFRRNRGGDNSNGELARDRARHIIRRHPRRNPPLGCLIPFATVGTIIILIGWALTAIVLLPTHWPPTQPVTNPNPHVKYYYMALGDSLAFGFQPNVNWDQGYASQWWVNLQQHGSRAFVDYGCNGETTYEFIHGGCPLQRFIHSYYQQPSQLDAAVAFLHAHPGQVSPISIDLGADDLLPDLNYNTCAIKSTWKHDLAAVDNNLTKVILPQLTAAANNSAGHRTADFWMLNYYNVFAQKCPNIAPYIKEVNQHLARDASQFSIPIVDVFSAFGENNHTNICKYTWRCSFVLQAIHPNSLGYSVITHALIKASGY